MSDQDRISPYNINMTSSRQVMGKQKMSMGVSLKIWLDSMLTDVKIEKYPWNIEVLLHESQVTTHI